MLRLEARRAIGAGPSVFGFLHIEHGRGKHLDIADVIGMGMGDRHCLDIRWLDPKLIELSRQSFGPAPVNGLRIRRWQAVRHGGYGIGDAGVPQEPALRVLDEIAGVDEVHRLAFVDAVRPARNIASNALTAIY